MTGTVETKQDFCPNCTKFGLPILPVRYAVSRSDHLVRTKAPPLEAPFGDGVQTIDLPASATYTLRLLRPGFLYVYDESADKWSAYQVDDFGSLTAFDIRDPSPPPQADGPQAVCSRHGVPALAKCIVLPVERETTILWLAFSSTSWTPAVLSRHQSADYRERHMRRIDAGAWRTSAEDQPHLASLYQAKDRVAEFKLAPEYRPHASDGKLPTLAALQVTAGSLPLTHSLSDCIAMERVQLDDLLAKAREAGRQTTPDHPQGVTPAIVALDDPIGVAADLNQLVLERITEWEQEPERLEKKASASAIMSLREAIKNGALEEELEARRDSALLGRAMVGILAGPTARSQVMVPVQDWEDSWFRVEDEEAILRLGDESWRKYSQHLKDGNSYEVWLTQTYPAEQKAFYEDQLQALDEALVQWLQAPQLHEHMICNFDPADLDSGIQYQEAIAVILQDAASRGIVFNHILRCLQEEDPRQSTSLILRAQVWNQDSAVEAWAAAVEREGAGRPVPWGNLATGLFNALKETLSAQGAGKLSGAFENLAKYVEQLSGPLTTMVGQHVAGLTTGAALRLPHRMQIGLLGALVKVDNPGLEVIDLVGQTSPQNASRALASVIAVQAGLPNRLSAGRPAREILRAGGAAASGPGSGMRFGYVVLADADQVRLMNAVNIRGLMSQNAYKAALVPHYQAQQLHVLMRQSITGLGDRTLAFGVVGLIFAGASLANLNDEYRKAASGARGVKAANFAAGTVGLLGASAEVVGSAGNRLPWFSQKLSRPNRWFLRSATTRAQVIAGVGRYLTGIGGVVAGGLAVTEGLEDVSLSKVYGVGMIAGGIVSMVASAVLFSGAFAPVAIVLLVLAAVVTLVVAWFKPNDVERWLDKSIHFGRNSSGKFSDIEDQGISMKSIQMVQ